MGTGIAPEHKKVREYEDRW